jgi:hypothetical protein
VTQSRGMLIAALILLAPTYVSAQSAASVRAQRATAVLAEPRGTADAVGTVTAGDILEVLDQRDGWYLVRPPAGSTQTWRTGWINSASVVPLNAAAAAPGQPMATQVQTGTANRKGFIFGLGAGGGIHRAPVFPGFSAAGNTSEGAVITDLSIGYAPTDQILVYYSNQVAWSRSIRYDLVGVTGVGVTYMFSPSSPSAFLKGSVGGGIVADVDFDSGRVDSNDTGLGLTIGGGYEFARHWSIEAGAMFARLENGNNHTVLKATFNWVFY